MNWVKEFKAWIMKGNLIAIAVGLVLALAFADVVKAFTENIITPIIAAIGGKPDFAALSFSINGSQFRYGLFVNAVVAFLIVALVLFFVVKASLRAFRETPPAPPEYVVERIDAAALNARAADGWEVVASTDAGVIMKR